MGAEQLPRGFDGRERSVPLPRGRTNLSPEAVAQHQRERVIVGVSTTLAERGFGNLTIESIITAARISRTTFYDHFANKQEAVIFAQETVFKRLLTAIRRACGEQREWPQKVEAAIGMALDFAEARPAQAQLLAAEFLAGDPTLSSRARGFQQQLVDLLSEGRRYYPKAASLPQVTEPALIGALSSLITRSPTMDAAERAAMRGQLVELTLIPYLGSARAAAAALEAP